MIAIRSRVSSFRAPMPRAGECRSVLGAVLLILCFFCLPAWAGTETTTTSLSITSSGTAVASAPYGTLLTLTATVTAGTKPITKGQVLFCDATAKFCTDIHLIAATQLTPAGTASWVVRPSQAVHSYRAIFLPTTLEAGSTSAAVNVSVGPSGTPHATSVSLAQAGGAGSYTLTATVPATTTTLPTGSVTFKDADNSGYVLGTANVRPVSSGITFNLLSNLNFAGQQPTGAILTDYARSGYPGVLEIDSLNGVTRYNGGGNGNLGPAPASAPSGFQAKSFATADFNDDGLLDYVTTNTCGNMCTQKTSGTLGLNLGSGVFNSIPPALAVPYTGPNAISVATADFNGDGEADIAILDGTNNTVTVVLGSGAATFAALTPLSVSAAVQIATADVNGDGVADLLVLTQAGTIQVYLGVGDGTFKAGASVSTSASPAQLLIADLNNDGHADLVVTGTGGGPVNVFLGAGDGTFAAAPASAATALTHILSATIADINGDGIPDLVTADGVSSTETVLLGNGDGTFTSIGQTPSTGAPVGLTVAGDLSNDGLADIVSIDPSTGRLYVTVTVPGTNAVATLAAVAPVGTGTHTLMATYSGDPTYAVVGSNSISVTATPFVTTLSLSANPLKGTAPVTLTATLGQATAQNHAAGGSVTFAANGSALGTASVANGVATLTMAVPAGTTSLAATYSGDTNFAATAAPAVPFGGPAGPASTTTTLRITAGGSTSPATSVGVGTPVTLTATVVALKPCIGSGCLVPQGVTPGQVNFCDASAPHCTDISLIGTAQLTASGTATFRYVPGIGTHTYKAVFVGTNTYVTSSSATAGLSVTGAYPSVTTLTATGVVGNYTLIATVEGAGHVAPTGAVSFLDTNNSGYVLATQPLSAVTTGFTFYNSSTPPNGVGPESAAVGDFNGDGILDMAVANEGSNTVTILLGKGDGTFAAAADVPAGTAPIDVVAGDFNNDGILDLAVCNDVSNNITILLGKGDGTFTVVPVSPSTNPGPFAITLGDFNGDGNLDMAVANIGDPTGVTAPVGSTVSVLLGRGDGTFAQAPTLTPGVAPSSVVAADFNEDGKTDLVVSNSAGTALSLFFGNGDGTFTQTTDVPTNTDPFWIVTADFNRDGHVDMAVGDLVTGRVAVLLGKGDGTFNRAPDIPTAGRPNFAMAAGDLNGDGLVDLAITNSNADSLLVVLGNGDGTFTATTSPATGSEPDYVISADFDGDGNQDLAVANFAGNSTSILLSKSTATATATGVSVVGTGTHLVDAVYGGDSHFGTSTSNSVPLTAQPLTVACTLAVAPSLALYGTPITFTATLTSIGNTQNHAITGTVSFNYFNGSSIGTAPVGTNGVSSFTTTALPAGANSFTAAYSGDADFVPCTTSAVTVIVTQSAPILTFSVPDHVYLDPPFAVAAKSNSPGAITYSVLSGPATVSGSTVTLTGAGMVTLQVSQASSGVYAAATATASFNVAKAAQTITFPAPSSPVAYGTVVTLGATASSGLAVVYSVVSGPAMVSGSTLTFTGAGTVVVAADQPGNANYAAAPEVTRTITVTPVYPVVTLTATPNPVFLLNPVTFTATVSAGAVVSQAVPSGTVTLVEGTTALGTVSLASGVATFQTSSLSLGAHTLTALYSGDARFTSISSPPVTVLVEDFTLVINNPDLVIPHGGTAVYSLTVTPIGGPGMAATINFSTLGAPNTSGISFSPATVATGAATTNVLLTIHTPNYPVGPWGGDGPYNGALMLIGVGGLLLPFGRARRAFRGRAGRLSGAALLVALAIASTAVSGCGSGWGPQHYTVKVTATSGSLNRSATAKLESR